MTITARRVIAWSFVAAFLIIAPITLLYTTGFRYNWQKKKIGEVGILAIKTFPPHARIYVNNQPQKNTSPLYLNNLEQNIYAVRTELQGYFPWEKNMEVKSRESTLAYDITLFKQSQPKQIVKGAINAYAFDRTRAHLAVVRENSIVEIHSADGALEDKFYTSPQHNLQKVRVSWSVNNSYLLIENLKDATASFIVATDKHRAAFSLNSLANGQTVLSPRFALNDDGVLYGISGQSLIKISLKEKLRHTQVLTHVQSFEITPLGIIALVNKAASVEIMRISNNLILNPTEPLGSLPRAAYTILPGALADYIAIADVAKNKILLVNTRDQFKQYIELSGFTGSFGAGEKNNVFAAISANEINIFNFKTQRSILLGRYGKTPQDAIPLYNTPYYLLYVDGKLNITELDDRDKRNVITLLPILAISNISTDASSGVIFYTSPEGLFVLEIQ